MNLININNSYHYEMENLIRVFLPDVKILRAEEIVEGEDYCLLSLDVNKISITLYGFTLGSATETEFTLTFIGFSTQ